MLISRCTRALEACRVIARRRHGLHVRPSLVRSSSRTNAVRTTGAVVQRSIHGRYARAGEYAGKPYFRTCAAGKAGPINYLYSLENGTWNIGDTLGCSSMAVFVQDDAEIPTDIGDLSLWRSWDEEAREQGDE